MSITLQLKDAERTTLEQLAENHRYFRFRRRALGVLALAKGHAPMVVAEILRVTQQSVYSWQRTWLDRGLMGMLDGHKGGPPVKLTPELLDTAEKIARKMPCTLGEIERQLREIHPEAPEFSLDRLSVGLKARGLTFKRTRLSLKKNAAQNNSGRHRKI